MGRSAGGSEGWVAEVEVGGDHAGHSRGSRDNLQHGFKYSNILIMGSPLCLLLSGALAQSVS